MTSETQQKIIDLFLKETNFRFNYFDSFLSENDITIIDENSVLTAIKNHQNIINNIIIPKKIRESREWIGNKYSFVKDEKIPQYKTVKYYEKGITEKEVRQLEAKKEKHQGYIYYLNKLLRITKRLNPEGTIKINIIETKAQNKRDTRPKEQILLNSFIETAYNNVMEKQSDIAKHLELSEGTISRYFNRIEFLQKLFNLMKNEYNEISKNQYDDEFDHDSKSIDNFSLNFSLIKSRLENIQDKKKFEKAKKDLSGLTENEKKLQIKNKN